MFYSPKHKVVVSRQRKINKIELTQYLVPGNASFEVIWKYAQATLVEDLRRLLQFVEEYANATIDKTSKV